MTTVVNIHVADIRPEYDNLREWMEDPNNIYIGRGRQVFIDDKRYPEKDSIWCNPFKVKKGDKSAAGLNKILKQYETYIRNKIETENLQPELMKLAGKNLGCWCKPKRCHGDILVKLIALYGGH